MTRNFSKVTAALVATLTISAAAASFTTETASAGWRGERRGHVSHMTGHRGKHFHGHRHWHGGSRGFGRGMGRSLAVGMGVAMIGGLIVAAANQPYAEGFDPATGERVHSTGKPRRHVITRTSRNGKVTREGGKQKPDSATSVENGKTTTSTADGKGRRDVTSNDGKGNVTNSKSGGKPASMSWTDPTTGVTTTITSDGKGGSTMARTNAAGEVLP
jgi:hypothetical protein